jgi:hypothetical protein
MTAESSSDPRQPNRFEKKEKHIPANGPIGKVFLFEGRLYFKNGSAPRNEVLKTLHPSS